MEILIIASLVTALLAGIAALFAPCCIGVLLPAYFASIFRQKKTILLMTLVFFFGLLAIFLPLGLGFGFIGQMLKQYHNLIYGIGAGFLFLLGISILLGYHFSLPFQTKSQIKVTGIGSVFILGVFSAFATLCCAPVLAGALALSALPGSIFWGGIYSVFYVIGMVAPLFVISYFVDKTKIMEKILIFKKEIKYNIFGKDISVSVSNLLSGIIFIIMAWLIIYFMLKNQLTNHSASQMKINIIASQLTAFLISVLEKIPVWLVLSIIALIIITVILLIKNKLYKGED